MARLMIAVTEGYVAGGADRVLANLLPYFRELHVELLVNSNLDTSVLLSRPLPSHVSLRKYLWATPGDIGNWAATATSPVMKMARRIFSVLLHYPVDMFLFLRLLRYFRTIRPDVLFINNGGYPGSEVCRMAAVAAAVHGGIQIVHLIHNMPTLPEKLFFPVEWIIDRLLERQGCLVAVSEAVAQSLRQRRRLKADIITIPNGLPISAPPSPPQCGSPIKFLQVGYLGKIKNQKLSILALGILAKQSIKNIQVTFAGNEIDKGYLHALIELAEQLGVSNQIFFTGFVKDIEGLYSQHDAVLLTSVVEGMPMCILEAMRAGRATVATDVGGVSELLEHTRTGYLLKGSSSEELAEVWKNLLKNPDTLTSMGARAYKRFIGGFTLDAQADKFLKLINSSPL